MDVDEFLRGLDEPPEVMRSMTAFLRGPRGVRPGDLGRRPETGGAARRSSRRHAGRGRARRRGRTRSRRASGRCSPTTAGDAAARRRARSSRSSAADDDGLAAAALAAASGARVAAGRRASVDVVRARRPQPDALPSRRGHARRSCRSPDPADADHGRMQVVYTPGPPRPRHHAPRRVMGRPIPANEVAERAERIRDGARGRRRLHDREPTEHGEAPITAVHDPGLVRFLEVAWSEVRRQGDRAAVPVGRHVPEPSDVRGHERRVRDRGSSASRTTPAGGPAAGASTRRRRSSPGTYGARAAAVDVALTTVDLVLGGEQRGLRPVPAARAPRRALDVRRLLLLQQRGDRGRRDHRGDRRAGRDPRRRLPPRQRHAADLLAARRRAVRLDPRRSRPRSTRTSSAVPTRPARATGRARTSTCRCRPGDRRRRYLAALDRGARGDRRPTPGSVVVVSLGFDTYGSTRSATSR